MFVCGSNKIVKIFNMRRQWRTEIYENIQANNPEIPRAIEIAMGPAIDGDLIIKLNETLTAEKKMEFLKSILNHENLHENLYLLISNSSPQVLEYIQQLLIFTHLDLDLIDVHLYKIANIFLLLISNMDIGPKMTMTYNLVAFIRRAMMEYDADALEGVLSKYIVPLTPEQIIENNSIKSGKNFLDCLGLGTSEQLEKRKNFLNGIGLGTEEQLEQHKNEFYKQVEEQEVLNKKRLFITMGIGVGLSVVLSFFGLPPIGGMIAKTVSNLSNN